MQWDIRGAERAKAGLRSASIAGQPVDVQYSRARHDRRDNAPKNTGTLYVRAIAADRGVCEAIPNEAYIELFSRFGEVKKVNPNRKRESEKFVEFFDLRSAESALSLNGYLWRGVTLEIQMANHQSKTFSKDAKDSDHSHVPHGYAPPATRSHRSHPYGRPEPPPPFHAPPVPRCPEDPYLTHSDGASQEWRRVPALNLLFTGRSAGNSHATGTPLVAINLGGASSFSPS